MDENRHYATGRRKTSIARTWISPGTGRIIVNGKPFDEYFTVESAKKRALQALELVKMRDQVDVRVNVRGGGLSGQAGAMRHGITKALIAFQPELRAPLKKAGYVTRDPRAKERKKYGQRGARARFQFSKR
ncbi:MAG: 30S ribosomal protein S9 [Deltaproteobacteria bacterium]|nr:30S ribosomal protein S9 [Deltaproteobacteria bacterium]